MAESLLDYQDVTKDHWETIQQWRIDEGKNFARSRSNQITRMAAGGMKAGAAQWETNLASIDAAHIAEKESQQGSATMGILDRWTAQMKDFYVNAAKAPETVTIQNKGDGREVQRYTPEYNQLQDSGGSNIYTDSEMSEQDFRAMSTDEFMKLSFGTTGDYSDFSDEGGQRAAADKAEGQRQQAARSQVQTSSPWWG